MPRAASAVRPRSAVAVDRPARRPRRHVDGGPGRRSRLRAPARRPGPAADRRGRRPAARRLLRAQRRHAVPARPLPEARRRCSCMPWRRPIAAARISMARTCWRAVSADQGRIDDGWLNRALTGIAVAGQVAPQKGLSIGAVVPLIMRGKAPVLSMSTQGLQHAAARCDGGAPAGSLRSRPIRRLPDLLAGASRSIASAGGAARMRPSRAGATGGGQRNFANFIETAEAAARS